MDALLTAGDALRSQALAQPDRMAVTSGQDGLTFRELDRRADAVAWLLYDQGIRPGDRVATLLPNGLTAVEVIFGASRAGCVLSPVGFRLQAPEVAHQLRDAGPRLIVAAPELLAGVRDAVPAGLTVVLDDGRQDAPTPSETTWDDQSAVGGYAALREAAAARGRFVSPVGDAAPWTLVYTSGTTGRPKGALRTQRSDALVGPLVASALGLGPRDAALAILPLFHINSIWFVTLSLCVGARCHLYPHGPFQPGRVFEEIQRSQASYAMFVPTMLSYLADFLEAGRATCDSLRMVLTSSAPLSPDLRQRLLRVLPHAAFVEIYGATELGPVTWIEHTQDSPSGSVGFPLPGVRVRLLGQDGRPVPRGEVGELFVESPMLMDGYFGRPEATEAARAGTYLSVGDLAREGERGELYLVERLADTIIVAGANVYPTEVEHTLAAHPAVQLAAVIGLGDARRGESVAAAVVERPGMHASPAELAAHCRSRLADYKCPRSFAYATELPLGPAGKVVRRAVRALWQQGAFRTESGAPTGQ